MSPLFKVWLALVDHWGTGAILKKQMMSRQQELLVSTLQDKGKMESEGFYISPFRSRRKKRRRLARKAWRDYRCNLQPRMLGLRPSQPKSTWRSRSPSLHPCVYQYGVHILHDACLSTEIHCVYFVDVWMDIFHFPCHRGVAMLAPGG